MILVKLFRQFSPIAIMTVALIALLVAPAVAGALTEPADYPAVTVTVVGRGTYTLSETQLSSIISTSTIVPGGLPTADMSADQYDAVIATGKVVADSFYLAPQSGRYIYNGRLKRMTILGGRAGVVVSRGMVAEGIFSGFETYDGDGSIEVTVTPISIAPTALGKAIVVDKSLRKLYLYDKGRKVLTYRCTIGARGYTTPSGYFTIGAMRKNPSWGNPGSAWARNMPRYIKPGPTNPLGVRAINMNRFGRDTGLRIHGTSNTRQIGMAASHGCIRLTNSNVTTLFSKVKPGTPIIVQP